MKTLRHGVGFVSHLNGFTEPRALYLRHLTFTHGTKALLEVVLAPLVFSLKSGSKSPVVDSTTASMSSTRRKF